MGKIHRVLVSRHRSGGCTAEMVVHTDGLKMEKSTKIYESYDRLLEAMAPERMYQAWRLPTAAFGPDVAAIEMWRMDRRKYPR